MLFANAHVPFIFHTFVSPSFISFHSTSPIISSLPVPIINHMRDTIPTASSAVAAAAAADDDTDDDKDGDGGGDSGVGEESRVNPYDNTHAQAMMAQARLSLNVVRIEHATFSLCFQVSNSSKPEVVCTLLPSFQPAVTRMMQAQCGFHLHTGTDDACPFVPQRGSRGGSPGGVAGSMAGSATVSAGEGSWDSRHRAEGRGKRGEGGVAAARSRDTLHKTVGVEAGSQREGETYYRDGAAHPWFLLQGDNATVSVLGRGTGGIVYVIY